MRQGAVDIIEVFNAKIADPALNDRAAELAGTFSLPGGAGSDAHDAPGVGAAYLEMPDFDGPASSWPRWARPGDAEATRAPYPGARPHAGCGPGARPGTAPGTPHAGGRRAGTSARSAQGPLDL